MRWENQSLSIAQLSYACKCSHWVLGFIFSCTSQTYFKSVGLQWVGVVSIDLVSKSSIKKQQQKKKNSKTCSLSRIVDPSWQILCIVCFPTENRWIWQRNSKEWKCHQLWGLCIFGVQVFLEAFLDNVQSDVYGGFGEQWNDIVWYEHLIFFLQLSFYILVFVILSSCSGVWLYQEGFEYFHRSSGEIVGDWSEEVDYGVEWGVLLVYFWCSIYLEGGTGCGSEVVEWVLFFVCVLFFRAAVSGFFWWPFIFLCVVFFCSISNVSLAPNMFSICCSYIPVPAVTVVLPLSCGRMVIALSLLWKFGWFSNTCYCVLELCPLSLISGFMTC